MTGFLILFVVIVALMTFLLRRRVVVGTYVLTATPPEFVATFVLDLGTKSGNNSVSVVFNGRRGFFITTVSR